MCTEEEFSCLSLVIPLAEMSSTVTLQNCFDESFAEELILEGWDCKKCGLVDAAMGKGTQLLNLPKVLTIHLKRFKSTDRGYIKDNTVVWLPQGELKVLSSLYRLVGVVNHVGSMNSGHYTARVKLNNRWKSCDDRRVRDDPTMTRFSKEAYLLFYERIDSEFVVSSDQGC